MEEEYTYKEKLDFLTGFLDEGEKEMLNHYVMEVVRILDVALQRAEKAVRML